jgi:hypothetical protein
MENPYVDQELLLNIHSEDLLNFCSVNKRFQNLCYSDEFWREKFRRNNLSFIRSHNNSLGYVRDFKKSTNLPSLTEKHLNETLKETHNNEITILSIKFTEISMIYVPEVNFDLVNNFKLYTISENAKYNMSNPIFLELGYISKDNLYNLRLIYEKPIDETFMVLDFALSIESAKMIIYRLLFYHAVGEILELCYLVSDISHLGYIDGNSLHQFWVNAT